MISSLGQGMFSEGYLPVQLQPVGTSVYVIEVPPATARRWRARCAGRPPASRPGWC